MVINLDGWEIGDAVRAYIKKKYSVEVSPDAESWVSINQYKAVYRQNKNGSLKKKKGMPVVDEEKSETVTHTFRYPEGNMTYEFYLEGANDED